MDYFSASSVVLFNLYAVLVRLIDELLLVARRQVGGCRSASPAAPEAMDALSATGDRSSSPAATTSSLLPPPQQQRGKSFLFLAIAGAFAAFYWRHVSRMMDYFDYGYNMKVNIAIGSCGGSSLLSLSCVDLLPSSLPLSCS